MPKVLCDYCMNQTEYVNSQLVYGTGRDYGMIYYCRPCAAWVGVHKGTDKPLGRLANITLRRYKQRAHALFDPLYKRVMERDNISKSKARNRAYKWLAEKMGINGKYCHIGMFDVDQCKQVIEICISIGNDS